MTVSTDQERGPGRPVGVALLGCGTVGSEVVRLITTQSQELTSRVGAPVEDRKSVV